MTVDDFLRSKFLLCFLKSGLALVILIMELRF